MARASRSVLVPKTTGEGLEPSPALLCASRLVAAGVNVIPLLPRDKRPASRWESLQHRPLAQMDCELVDRYLNSWWGAGKDYGLAVVTGSVSGIVVVDVDDDAAKELVEQTCGWPRTVIVKTSKGWHLWFRHPGESLGNRVRVADVGLDVRADGGYVVVPPSIHPTGFEYEWVRSPFVCLGGMWPPAPMPDDLHDLLWPQRRVDVHGAPVAIHTRKYVAVALERELDAVRGASEGTRNHQLNRSAYAVARFITSGALPAGATVQAFLEAARAAGLAEREAEATIASALRARAS